MHKRKIVFKDDSCSLLTIINMTSDLYFMEGGCDINGSAFTSLGPGRHEICFCNYNQWTISNDVIGRFGITIWGPHENLKLYHYNSCNIIIIPPTIILPSLFSLAASIIPSLAVYELHINFQNSNKLLWTKANVLKYPITVYVLTGKTTGWIGLYTCTCHPFNDNSSNNLYCAINTKTLIPRFQIYDGPTMVNNVLDFWVDDDDVCVDNNDSR